MVHGLGLSRLSSHATVIGEASSFGSFVLILTSGCISWRKELLVFFVT
jgi:hypothetical protein